MKTAVHQKPLNLRVSEHFYADVVAAAASESMSVAEFVRGAIRRAINPDRRQVHLHLSPDFDAVQFAQIIANGFVGPTAPGAPL